MATWGNIQTSFLTILNRRDCSTTLAQQFLQSGVRRVQREVRCPAMEKSVVVTITSPYTGLWIPGDYLELIRLENSQGNALTIKSLDHVKFYNWNDVPQFYARQNKQWILGPIPVENDTVRIDYYAELAALVNSGDTNIMTDICPEIIWYAGLSYVGDTFSDDRVKTWEGRYVQLKNELNTMADDDAIQDGCVSPALSYDDC